jgi:hypothetical protein
MEAFCDKKTSKNIQKFVCNICDFTCSKKGDWNRHIMRPKHINLTLSNACCDKKNIYICNICDKKYSSRNGLWNHKKKCCIEVISEETNETPSNQDITPELIMSVLLQNKELNQMLIEQNKKNNELQKQMFEVCKNNTITNNITNTNSHNKSFNLNFFLNETCKDAMNIMDFVDSIKLQLSDLEKVGKNGFVEGISSIIVQNLNLLDETKRPVHCTDSKREVMYVKDEDKWEKENETKMKLRKAIKHVAHKNTKMLKEFRIKNPDCLKSTSKVSDQYNKLVMEAMGGKGDNDNEKEDKIIKNIAKEVTIDSKT